MRRILGIVSAMFVLALPLGTAAMAQEVQVPLDEAGRIHTVDRELALRLGLWLDEYPDFREARLFEAPGQAFVLEITTQRGGVQARTRVPLDAAGAAALRARVSGLLADRAPDRARPALNQEGRYLLMGQTTLAGVSFYGWALPYTLGLDGSGAAGAYLLTAGASFFLPMALTSGQPVTFGMANLSRYGVTRGIAHGLMLHELVEGDPEPVECPPDGPCFYEDDDSERTATGIALAFSIAEGLGGYLWARNAEMTPGTANAMVLGGDFGLGLGAGTGVILSGDADGKERIVSGLGLAGAAAGILGGREIARRRDFTWGDTDVIYTGGAVGAWAGVAAVSLFDDELESEEVGVGAAMLGAAAGLVLGDRLVRDTEFTVGQATLNRLGAIAGGLAGASLGVGVEDERVAFAGSALGAILGYYGTYRGLAPIARTQRGDRLTNLDVQLHPTALLTARGEGAAAVPVVSVRYRF